MGLLRVGGGGGGEFVYVLCVCSCCLCGTCTCGRPLILPCLLPYIHTPTQKHSAHTAWDDEDEEEDEEDEEIITNDNSGLLSPRLSDDPRVREKQVMLLGGRSMTGEAVQRLAALKVRV